MSGDSVFSTASSVTSNRWPGAVSPKTNTRRSSRPSSRVREGGSTLSERMGGNAGLGGGPFLFDAAPSAARPWGRLAARASVRQNAIRRFTNTIRFRKGIGFRRVGDRKYSAENTFSVMPLKIGLPALLHNRQSYQFLRRIIACHACPSAATGTAQTANSEPDAQPRTRVRRAVTLQNRI